METENMATVKALANVIAGMADEENTSYYADAVYILNAIRCGMVPGIVVLENR